VSIQHVYSLYYTPSVAYVDIQYCYQLPVNDVKLSIIQHGYSYKYAPSVSYLVNQ